MGLPVPRTAPPSVFKAAASMLAVTVSLAPKRSLTSAWCAVGMVLAALNSLAPSENSGLFTIYFLIPGPGGTEVNLILSLLSKSLQSSGGDR